MQRKSSRRSSSRSSAQGRCKMDSLALAFIDSIDWDVTSNVTLASNEGRPVLLADQNRHLCSGTLNLLLPIGHQPFDDATNILYEVTIRKSSIKVGDIMDKIYRFYNLTTVSRDDLENLRVISTHRDTAEFLLSNYAQVSKIIRFKDFIKDGGTMWNGLIAQNSNSYVVRLGGATSARTSLL